MTSGTRHVGAALGRLSREAKLWREEPARRVALRNRPLHPWRSLQFHSFGPYSFVDRPWWLYGTQWISVGTAVMILRGAWLAAERAAWDKPRPIVRIGDRVSIRPGCTISATESIIVEDDVLMGAYVTVIDSNHTWAEASANPLGAPLRSAPVRIGRGTWLADRVTVAAGADIGRECAVGANSFVNSTIPDYSIVVGSPGRVVGSTRKD